MEVNHKYNERRRGLEWIVSYEDDWYDLEMNA